MKKILLSLILAFFSVAVSAQTVAPGDAEKEKIAISAAMAWVKLIDGGKYNVSWTDAASYFKSKVTSDQWTKAVEGVRKPYGKLVARKLKSKALVRKMPGAPDGEYVIIQFETEFANKKGAIETVTPMLDKDKQWRVSGYYIN